jgi:hypothetical protein
MDIVETKFEAVVAALDLAHDDPAGGAVTFCHGIEKCELTPEERSKGCLWCHNIEAEDPRTPWEILDDMKAQANGH